MSRRHDLLRNNITTGGEDDGDDEEYDRGYELDKTHYCSGCSGSGEGSYSGSVCPKCHGSGEQTKPKQVRDWGDACE